MHPLFDRYKEKIDREIAELPLKERKLDEIVAYAAKDGGKRIRPVLLMFFGEDLPTATKYGAALELIHSYSLVHDDLPSMDDDDERRGKPSVHKKYGEAMGILGGDALLNLAYEILLREASEYNEVPIEDKLIAASVIAKFAGMKGMIYGQELDIEGSEDFGRLIYYKTCNLFMAACGAGCLLTAGSTEEFRRALAFGKYYGYLFQLTDDLQDLKEDQRAGKRSYATVNGEEKTRNLIGIFHEKAMNIARKDSTGFLEELVERTTERI